MSFQPLGHYDARDPRHGNPLRAEPHRSHAGVVVVVTPDPRNRAVQGVAHRALDGSVYRARM